MIQIHIAHFLCGHSNAPYTSLRLRGTLPGYLRVKIATLQFAISEGQITDAPFLDDVNATWCGHLGMVTARGRYFPSGSSTSYRVRLSESTVGQDIQFFVLIRDVDMK